MFFIGSFGETMVESAHAAMAWVRSYVNLRNEAETPFANQDVYLYLGPNRGPKDGASAGLAFALALVSLLLDIRIESRIAVTGEISVQGNVTRVEYIREKALAAYSGGIQLFVYPSENEDELTSLPPEVLSTTKLVPVRTVQEATDVVFGSLIGESSS